VSFAAIILCVASQRVFIVVVISLSTQSGNFWIYPRTCASNIYLLLSIWLRAVALEISDLIVSSVRKFPQLSQERA
jgi:hypothetical protein